MPRPGMLTKGKANRRIKTPGGRTNVHRRSHYKAGGVCAVTGDKLQLPRKSRTGLCGKASKSSKRPNRPYGGVLSPQAMRRGITKALRD